MKNRLDLLSCVGTTLSTAVCYIWECVERRREQAVLGFKALFTGGSGSQGANEEATPQQEPVLAYQGHIRRATVGKCDVKLSLQLLYMHLCGAEGGCCEAY